MEHFLNGSNLKEVQGLEIANYKPRCVEVPGYEVELRNGVVVDKKAKISLARDQRKADERSVWQ